MSIILRKVLTKDHERLIRSAFAEDIPLLTLYNGIIGKGLDEAGRDFLNVIKPDSVFFRIENQYGAFAGFFTLRPGDNQMSFHLRNSFRTDEYKIAFWALVNETLNNDLYMSIDGTNLTALPGILKNIFHVKNQLEYHGKNYLLLKINN